jgi:hypothetical protein
VTSPTAVVADLDAARGRRDSEFADGVEGSAASASSTFSVWRAGDSTGGSVAGAEQTAEWIDLSVAAPTWKALPNMNVPRDSVLLPDDKTLVVLEPAPGECPYKTAPMS